MTVRIHGSTTQGSRETDHVEDPKATPEGRASGNKRRADETDSPSPAVEKLKRDHDAAARGAGRIAIAKRSMDEIAGSLPGHGVDVDALAAKYAAASYGRLTPAQLAATARQDLVRGALANRPDLAGRAIALRTAGVQAQDRELVGIVVQRSGTSGAQRLAACERVLQALRPFSKEERGDILGLVKAGAGFDSAVDQERGDLKRIQREPSPTASPDLHAQAKATVAAAQAGASAWKKRAEAMNAAWRDVRAPSRGAEIAVGVVQATGALGSLELGAVASPLARDAGPLRAAADEAARSIGYVNGDLSARAAHVDSTYRRFGDEYAAYVQQNRDFQHAVLAGDPAAVNEASTNVRALESSMRRSIAELEPLAKGVARETRQFDADTGHVAVQVAVSAASAGIGGHAPPAGTKLVEWGAIGAKDALKESALTWGIERVH